MKYRRLDNSGDYTFGANSNDFCEGNEAIKQAIETKIKLFYGEWWEDLGIGIPFMQSLIGKIGDENLLMSANLLLRERIKEVEGVTSIDKVGCKVENRTLVISIDVSTIYSSVSLEVSI